MTKTFGKINLFKGDVIKELSSIFLCISSRVLARPATRNRSFAAPQYCSMKFNSQWYLG